MQESGKKCPFAKVSSCNLSHSSVYQIKSGVPSAMKKTAIIVPCYNEAHRLKPWEFIKYAQENKGVSFVFVNDGSTDETQSKINEILDTSPVQIQCVKLQKNCGKAMAIYQGVLKAMEMDFENIGYWDADLSTPLTSVNRLCRVLDNPRVTIVMGSRVKLLGRKVERMMLRHYLGRIFATLASMLLELPVYDTQCGAKIFKNNFELKKAFARPFSVRWTFDVELLARLKIIKKKYRKPLIEASAVEYPLEEWTHMPGSKIKIRNLFSISLEFFKLALLLHAPGISYGYGKQFKT